MYAVGLDRKKGVKIPNHLDIENPHSFEIEDLKKLIQTVCRSSILLFALFLHFIVLCIHFHKRNLKFLISASLFIYLNI